MRFVKGGEILSRGRPPPLNEALLLPGLVSLYCNWWVGELSPEYSCKVGIRKIGVRKVVLSYVGKVTPSLCTNQLSILLSFEFLSPIPRKFMVGAVGHFILQPMARTNHKFPGYRASSYVQSFTLAEHRVLLKAHLQITPLKCTVWTPRVIWGWEILY